MQQKPTAATSLFLSPKACCIRFPCSSFPCSTGSFRKLGVPYLGVLIIRILLFGVLYWGPVFSETPTVRNLTESDISTRVVFTNIFTNLSKRLNPDSLSEQSVTASQVACQPTAPQSPVFRTSGVLGRHWRPFALLAFRLRVKTIYCTKRS